MAGAAARKYLEPLERHATSTVAQLQDFPPEELQHLLDHVAEAGSTDIMNEHIAAVKAELAVKKKKLAELKNKVDVEKIGQLLALEESACLQPRFLVNVEMALAVLTKELENIMQRYHDERLKHDPIWVPKAGDKFLEAYQRVKDQNLPSAVANEGIEKLLEEVHLYGYASAFKWRPPFT